MKKLFILCIVSIVSFTSFAQNEKYIAAMKKNIALIDSALRNPDALLGLANTFERIGTVEKAQWLPYYYAALCRVNYGFMQKDATGNDPIAEYATNLINKADSLQPNNSEVSCIRSMIASLQMLVNTQARYMQYGAVIQKAMQTAMAQDPTNPRPYMLKGQNLKFTPPQFGGGCKTALEALNTAAEKFNTFKPASDIAPNWGKTYTEMMIKECAETK